jgi:hypothetical protein
MWTGKNGGFQRAPSFIETDGSALSLAFLCLPAGREGITKYATYMKSEKLCPNPPIVK